MSFANQVYLPSGTYALINARYNHRISFNEQDECLSTSGDDYGVSSSFHSSSQRPSWPFRWLSSGPFHSSRTRSGLFKAHQTCLWISHQMQRKEKTWLQWRIRLSHISLSSSAILGKLNPTCHSRLLFSSPTNWYFPARIYSQSQPQLFWSLPNGDEGTAVSKLLPHLALLDT